MASISVPNWLAQFPLASSGFIDSRALRVPDHRTQLENQLVPHRASQDSGIKPQSVKKGSGAAAMSTMITVILGTGCVLNTIGPASDWSPRGGVGQGKVLVWPVAPVPSRLLKYHLHFTSCV